jgi:hypothetical protein
MESTITSENERRWLPSLHPYVEAAFFTGIIAKFRRLAPLIRYPIVGFGAFFGLLPAVAFFYGLLVGAEFTVRYSLHQTYCAVCDEGFLISSRVTPPASCHDSDSELAHQTVRHLFTPADGPLADHD